MKTIMYWKRIASWTMSSVVAVALLMLIVWLHAYSHGQYKPGGIFFILLWTMIGGETWLRLQIRMTEEFLPGEGFRFLICLASIPFVPIIIDIVYDNMAVVVVGSILAGFVMVEFISAIDHYIWKFQEIRQWKKSLKNEMRSS